MSFLLIFFQGLLLIMIMMTILWGVSVIVRNVSIVDLFWGLGFVLTAGFYFLKTEGLEIRKIIILSLAAIWGLRLSFYLAWRNIGEGEDFRYKQFREKYGKKYWWLSYFQTFLLQGVLMWLISAPLLGAQFSGRNIQSGILDIIGIVFWGVGFFFETVGDLQLARFKADPANKGKVMDKGLWKYTRHPNYFGDSAVWWGFGILCLAAGSYIPVLGSILMTFIIIKISGVGLLEKSLKNKKPEYRDYIERTSAFLPWFPKKQE
jgi:steroid 5-alpha reductase family enzyme